MMQNSPSDVNPQVSATPTQKSSPNAQPSITISYHSVDLGCGRQCADITITNEGYQTFSTDPALFYIKIGDKNYTYSTAYTPTYGNWKNTSIADHASYSGTIIFNTPRTTDPFSLGYNDASFNITYVHN
jgi:hypothetical protein